MTCKSTFVGPYGETISIQLGIYQNGQPKIQLWADEDGGFKSPYGSLSVASAKPMDLASGEFLAKTWFENEEIASCALKSGLFIDTGRRVLIGHEEAHVWKIA